MRWTSNLLAPFIIPKELMFEMLLGSRKKVLISVASTMVEYEDKVFSKFFFTQGKNY